jgi:hypothetical protein
MLPFFLDFGGNNMPHFAGLRAHSAILKRGHTVGQDQSRAEIIPEIQCSLGIFSGWRAFLPKQFPVF